MLTHIQIRDYAIVDSLALDFAEGMTVLTGETGAGKSILVDALGLALGDRAEAGVVRHGAERAEVTVIFKVTPSTQAWLAARDLEGEDDCLVRRIVSREGRSRAYINGHPVPLQSLRELGEQLVDIHGQHAHQSLLSRDNQREVLDGYGGYPALVITAGDAWQALRELQQTHQRLCQAATDRESRLDYLRFQLEELTTLGLHPGELESLEGEHRLLANASRLLEGGQGALTRLQGEGSVTGLGLLVRARQELRGLRDVDSRLGTVVDLLENAVIQAQEAAGELRHYLASLELDPRRLAWVEDRLGAATELARKHRIPPTELPALTARLQQEVIELQQVEQRVDDLTSQLTTAQEGYQQAATALHQARCHSGVLLSQQVTDNLQRLGMPGGQFQVDCQFQESHAGPNGSDRVEFLVSTNPGQPFRPLAKVVSGGELSRISLSLQVLVATSLRVPTLIFDEVDVGIGGRVAEIVGRLLRQLGQRWQVLCVTHLPQVAAQGHHHLLVQKHSNGETTHTVIRSLLADERVGEIARLLGGVAITQQTLAHAQEIIALAQGN